MKRVLILILAAGLVLGTVAGVSAIDFKVKGEWDFYFNAGQTAMYKTPHDSRKNGAALDMFDPVSRVRLQIEAVVSENLFGAVQFEIGNYSWGAATRGALAGSAIGERSASVRMKRAYLDWLAPNTALRVRMGMQYVALPNAAGGSSVVDEDVMGVTLSYTFNEHAGLTALWMRPYNDNYSRGDFGGNSVDNAFDNLDLGMLALPLNFDGFSATPWAMAGIMGSNAARYQLSTGGIGIAADSMQRGLFPVDMSQRSTGLDASDAFANVRFKRAYSSLFWAGLPVTISAFDPFHFEVDVNYGYLSGFGRYDDARAVNADGSPRRNDTRHEGFIIKALAEYKTDWGVPGVFGWYGSGDNGNTRDGSERMPYLVPFGTFSSFGLGGYYGDFGSLQIGQRVDTGYAGTWAVGARIRDISFLDELSHVVRVIYWRGTNDPAMARALRSNTSDSAGYDHANTGWNDQPGGLYLTTNDYLVEFNLDSTYPIYENLEACVELGYIVNGVDKDTWKWSGNQKADAWKATFNLRYSF